VLPFAELLALTALLMALSALSIDIMLPSLPQIGAAFTISHINDTQQIVTTYLLGVAFGQLFWGPLSDRYGRKGLLLIGLVVFALGSIACLIVSSFALLLWARAVQGFGGAAARVISIAVVRDLFSGRQMARVMSMVMMVFITVPMLAPALGQALAYLESWRSVFVVLLLVAIIGIVWAGYRLPETVRSNGAAPLDFATAVKTVLTTPVTVGYSLATGFIFGCLVGYLSSAQQIFVDVYGLGAAFPAAFASMAGAQALASFTNSRLVQRLGMRRVSHLALVGFVAATAALSLVALANPPLVVFGLLLASAFFAFGLMVPNFNAIAMQPMGQVAGMAASLIGFYTTAVGAVFGWGIGRLFDGTVRPLAFGFAVLALCAFACVLAVEGRRGLFRGD
jgi:DHA1 family bicyclomycin/chloramphenicol resistance-like MFS transporter